MFGIHPVCCKHIELFNREPSAHTRRALPPYAGFHARGRRSTRRLRAGLCRPGVGGGGPADVTLPVAGQAIEECGPVPVVDPAALPADALVMPVGLVGSPAVSAERIGGRDEPARLRARFETLHGAPVAAVMSSEIGGLNGCVAVAWAARLGLPLLDADSMGRAFPRMDQNVLELAGLRPGPAVLADEHGHTVVIDDVDGAHLEQFARAAVVAFGGGPHPPTTRSPPGRRPGTPSPDPSRAHSPSAVAKARHRCSPARSPRSAGTPPRTPTATTRRAFCWRARAPTRDGWCSSRPAASSSRPWRTAHRSP